MQPAVAPNVRPSTAVLLAAVLLAPGLSRAAEAIQLTLKDHHFSPASITVPSDSRFRLEVTNLDPTPAEFESPDLRAEKIVVPGGHIMVMAGPLKAGTYSFVDDYHPDVAHGTATAKPGQE